MMNLYAILWPIPPEPAGVEFLEALVAMAAGAIVAMAIMRLARTLKR